MTTDTADSLHHQEEMAAAMVRAEARLVAEQVVAEAKLKAQAWRVECPPDGCHAVIEGRRVADDAMSLAKQTCDAIKALDTKFWAVIVLLLAALAGIIFKG